MTAKYHNAPLRAACLVVLCMMSVGYSDNLLPYITDDFGLWQFHAIRSLIACVLFYILGRFLGWDFVPRNIWGVLLRSVFFAVAMVFYFAALGFVPVAQAAAGLFTSPIFVLVFSVILFRLPIGIWRIFAVILGFFGALMVLQPSAEGFSWFSALPIMGGAVYALGLLVTRSMCADETPGVLAFWFFAAVGIFGALGIVYYEWISPNQLDQQTYLSRGWVGMDQLFLFITFVMGAITMAALTAQARGYQMADASYLAVFEYSFLISAAFWGWYLWGHELDVLSAFGMAAIAISGTIIAIRTGQHDNG